MKKKNWRQVCLAVAVVGILIGVLSCERASKFASYKAETGNTKDIAFYQKVPAEWSLERVDGKQVRNVIFCIGDGMGPNEVALARHKAVGQGGKLWMETMPVMGLMRTFSANSEITDSAAAATAMACSIKTKNETLGISPDGKMYTTILEALAKKGWRTGLVATSTISHATPAGFASHVKSRGSEREIAGQIFDNRVGVLFGGGEKYWLPDKVKGGRNLIEEAKAAGYEVVGTRDEMLKLTEGPALGLFEKDALNTYAPEPMLYEMANKAIGLLNKKGREWFSPEPKFFVMIEGSQIDWAGHNNDTNNSIRQTLLFDMAVKEALEFAKQDGQTLVIVTADHETGGLTLQMEKSGAKKFQSTWHTKDHTAAEVAIFAYGPGAEEFTGVMDNTDISKKIAKLTGVAPFPQVKEKSKAKKSDAVGKR